MLSPLVMVSGSRGWTDSDTIHRTLLGWQTRYQHRYGLCIPKLLHGGARGADTLAGDAARTLGWPVEVIQADWERHGPRAGILRNLEMLDRCPAEVLVFWDGRSRGTKHVIDECRRRRCSYRVYNA